MLSTIHIISGATLGVLATGSGELFFWSVILHFVLDIVPHNDFSFARSRKYFIWASIDMLLGLLLAFYLVGDRIDYMVILGIGFSILPDIVNFVIMAGRISPLKFYVNWHRGIQNRKKDWWGYLTGLIVIGICIYALVA
ncbi:hypothetical protein KJ855_02445 [Patescibacteria group bacterium]|nr:hypothetical protein [Patescibacteria group bacterium]